MAKYKWDLCELRNNIEIIKKLLEKENDPVVRDVMLDMIYQYNNMIKSVIPDNSINFQEMGTIYEFLNDMLKNTDSYDQKLINLLIETYPIIKNFVPTDDTQYIITKNNEVLLDQTNDFLKQTLNKSQFQRYMIEIEENPNHLHIQYSNQRTNGITFIDPILRKKYILLNRCNQPIDISTISHEYFHFVFNDYTSYQFSNIPLFYSIELEGSFSDFLTIEDLKHRNFDIASQLSQDFLFYFQNRIICLLILKCYSLSLDKKWNFRKNKFDKTLLRYDFNEDIDIDMVDDYYFGGEDLCDVLTYSLSYLGAMDLIEIYKTDPEFALYLLENIRCVRSEPDVLNVFRRNHISFMDDGFENLKKYVKKIERES